MPGFQRDRAYFLEQKRGKERSICTSLSRRDKMIRVKKPLLLFVLLFSLSACSQKQIVTSEASTPVPSATFTPFVAGTETAQAVELASPTPWVGGTETALAVQLASPTPWVEGTQTALAMPSPATPEDTPIPLPTISFPRVTPAVISNLPPEGTFSPIFYGSGPFLLVGGFKEDRGWLSGADTSPYVDPETSYDFFSPNGFFQVPGSALERSHVCENFFMPSSVPLPETMVGVASGWISEKRATRDLSTDDPSYIQAVTEWFQSQGDYPPEIHITRILQVDIEGDGVNEVLLSASYFKDISGHMTETGDYSMVLMRKVVGNEVLTIPLVKDYYISSTPELELSYPKTYTLAEALDLNRDGTLEVIVGVSRWEGGGAIVHRVDGQNVREVMRAIC
jgi:hypothetical protein